MMRSHFGSSLVRSHWLAAASSCKGFLERLPHRATVLVLAR